MAGGRGSPPSRPPLSNRCFRSPLARALSRHPLRDAPISLSSLCLLSLTAGRGRHPYPAPTPPSVPLAGQSASRVRSRSLLPRPPLVAAADGVGGAPRGVESPSGCRLRRAGRAAPVGRWVARSRRGHVDRFLPPLHAGRLSPHLGSAVEIPRFAPPAQTPPVPVPAHLPPRR